MKNSEFIPISIDKYGAYGDFLHYLVKFLFVKLSSDKTYGKIKNDMLSWKEVRLYGLFFALSEKRTA